MFVFYNSVDYNMCTDEIIIVWLLLSNTISTRTMGILNIPYALAYTRIVLVVHNSFFLLYRAIGILFIAINMHRKCNHDRSVHKRGSNITRTGGGDIILLYILENRIIAVFTSVEIPIFECVTTQQWTLDGIAVKCECGLGHALC